MACIPEQMSSFQLDLAALNFEESLRDSAYLRSGSLHSWEEEEYFLQLLLEAWHHAYLSSPIPSLPLPLAKVATSHRLKAAGTPLLASAWLMVVVVMIA